MADLPMAQIPNFSLGATPNPAPQAMAIQGAQGASQAFQGIQALNQQKQLQQAQIQQMQVQQNLAVVDSLTKNGIEYPSLMKSFWPAIANSMNKISPDYGLDPNTPPDDLGGAFKFLSTTNDALSAGVITPQQAHTVVKQNLQDLKPSAVPSGAVGENDQAAPTQSPPSLPGQQEYQQKFNQLASMGPMMAKEGLPLLEATPAAQQYKSALEQQRASAQTQQTHTLQLKQDMMNQLQTHSDTFKQVASNFNVATNLLSNARPADQAASPEEALQLAAQEKTAMGPMMQMLYPETGRPGNPQFMEHIEKTGDWSTLGEQAIKRVFVDGQALTGSQLKAFRTDLYKIYQSREQDHSQLENSFAATAQANGIDPSQIVSISNPRPQNVVSTSKFYPAQGTQQSPLIGQITKGREGKSYQFLGGNSRNPDNWISAESNE
jgi:hypothetical protein